MIEKENKINSKQLMILIITTQIGTGVLTLPALLAKNVGHDGWISVVLTGFTSLIILFFILALLKRYSNKSIIEINKLIFGKYLGKINNLIIIIYLCFSTIVLLRAIVEVVHITLLVFTPKIVLTFLVLSPTIYLCWNGLKNFCRYSGFTPAALFFILLTCVFVSKDFRLTNLKPIGYAGIKSILNGIYISAFSYFGFEITAIIYPEITDKNKTLKYALCGNLISGFFFTAIVLFITGIFGESLTKHLVFPLFNIPRILDIPYIERVDIYFMALWLPLMGGSCRAYFISSFYSIKKVFNFKKNGLPYAIFSCAVIFMSRIPSDFDALYNYERLLTIFGIIINLYLVFCYFLSFIIKRGIEDI